MSDRSSSEAKRFNWYTEENARERPRLIRLWDGVREFYYYTVLNRAARLAGSPDAGERASGRALLEGLIGPVKAMKDEWYDLWNELWSEMVRAQLMMDVYGDYFPDAPGTFRRRFAYNYLDVAPEERWGPDRLSDAMTFRDMVGHDDDDADSAVAWVLAWGERQDAAGTGKARVSLLDYPSAD